MTDKEVGELLDRTQRTLIHAQAYPHKDWDNGRVQELCQEQLSLIRKLVEEECRYQSLDGALRRYSIDPKNF